MKPAIEIKQLGKKYRIRSNMPYVALRDVITGAFSNIFDKSKQSKQDFWALQDINLEVQQGERVGIIGRNGAGKSTLLKILSRITWPTTGEAIIRGRLASLLEVGTGFHPELTGRENIFLNGSIMGLKKKEIEKQFDAIVDFSGVSVFLNTPLKNYSTGMQLRLAFAVAAHLEPEVLIIDEVLAVGDMEFQKKCLGKMEEVSKENGKTILFVSHNMSYISSLCNTAIFLEQGRIIERGPSTQIVSSYLTQIADRSAAHTWKPDEQPGNEIVRLQSLTVVDTMEKMRSSFKVSEKIGIEMHYEVIEGDTILWLGFNIHNQDGVNVFDTHSVNSQFYNTPHKKGKYKAISWIPSNLLNTGNYYISCAIFNHIEKKIHLHEKEILLFNVYDVFDEETARGMSGDDFPGVIRPLLEWNIEKI